LTVIAALRVDGLTAPYVIDGAMDGITFMACVEQVLVPTLAKGDIVFMDNLRTHKIDGVRQAIAAVSATVRYLPAYSPDLNPIEMAFSKLKAAQAMGDPPPCTRRGGVCASIWSRATGLIPAMASVSLF
jgi:transposase